MAVLLAAGAFCLGATGWAGPVKVAVLSADIPSWPGDVVSKISGTGLFSAVDNIDVTTTTPSVATLSQYAAVFVYSDAGFADAATLGNNLATYVSGGGGVVLAVCALGSVDLGGNFASGGYMPVNGGGLQSGTVLTLVKDLPSNPILTGVTSFNGGTSSYFNAVSIVSGATLVAHWNNGYPLVVTKPSGSGTVVALNFYPVSSDMRSDFWPSSTSGARLMANALSYASGAYSNPITTITTEPASQTVVVDDNVTFSVTAAGTAPLHYQWYFNGSTITGATATNYSITEVRTSAAGSYSVVVTNSSSSATSSVAVLTVNKATPVVNIWPTAGGITYLQALSASVLSGGSASVGGTFAFTAPATTPPVGTYAASVTFTPTDTDNYNYGRRPGERRRRASHSARERVAHRQWHYIRAEPVGLQLERRISLDRRQLCLRLSGHHAQRGHSLCRRRIYANEHNQLQFSEQHRRGGCQQGGAGCHRLARRRRHYIRAETLRLHSGFRDCDTQRRFRLHRAFDHSARGDLHRRRHFYSDRHIGL